MRAIELIAFPQPSFGTALRALACGLTALVTFGCAASIQGAPPRLFPVGIETDYVRAVAGPESFANYAAAPSEAIRDQIVFGRIYAIDIAYTKYEMDLTRELQSVGFLSTLTQLGISTAGTFVGGEEAKTILHAAETGVTGAKAAYEKDILLDRTISALQQQMRAERLNMKAKIITRLQNGINVYPLEFALSDVEEYYRAGTITGALIQASKDAGESLQIAAENEANVVSVVFGETILAPRIRRFWRANPFQKSQVEDWLIRNGITVGPTLFLNSTEFAAEQARMVDELSIP